MARGRDVKQPVSLSLLLFVSLFVSLFASLNPTLCSMAAEDCWRLKQSSNSRKSPCARAQGTQSENKGHGRNLSGLLTYTPRLHGGGAAHTAGFFGQLKHMYKKSVKNIVFFSVFTMCSVENTVIYAVFGIKSVQNSGFCSVFNALASKNWNTAVYTVFFKFSMCQCRWPTQTYIQKIIQKHCFFQCFYIFSVKNAVIYTFFGLKSVQNTGSCSVFNALASKNHSKYRYLQCFFISVRFSLAGSRPKWPKIPFQYPLKLRHPKIVEKTRKHHQYEVSVRNSFCPPPAKADIATAILTNVIKHLV